MTTSDEHRNPYAAPRVSSERDVPARLSANERIEFAGTVDRQRLRDALRTRISWSGLATFGVISLICLAASPSSLTLPWIPASLPVADDLAGEIISIVGLGFFIVGVWHVIASSTRWGLNRREQSLLQFSPYLYDWPTSGYLQANQIFLNQRDGQAWLAWDAVEACQFGVDVFVVQWGRGVLGSTVFMRDMFSSSDAFDQAVRMFADHADPSRKRMVGETSYFESDDARARTPKLESAVATVKHHVDFASAVRAMFIEIPITILKSSKPLHLFFLMLIAMSLLLTRLKLQVSLVIAAVWVGIWLLACVLSMWQNRQLLWSSRESHYASRFTFFSNEVHIATSFAYFIIPLDTLVLDDFKPDLITIRQQGYSIANTLRRQQFESEEDWLAVRTLFA